MLTLPIKKRWYDMIFSGEKKEEYRELSRYYRTRFRNIGLLNEYGLATNKTAVIAFRNGYRSDSPTFIAECYLVIKTGRRVWGAEEGRKYYALQIKKIIRK